MTGSLQKRPKQQSARALGFSTARVCRPVDNSWISRLGDYCENEIGQLAPFWSDRDRWTTGGAATAQCLRLRLLIPARAAARAPGTGECLVVVEFDSSPAAGHARAGARRPQASCRFAASLSCQPVSGSSRQFSRTDPRIESVRALRIRPKGLPRGHRGINTIRRNHGIPFRVRAKAVKPACSSGYAALRLTSRQPDLGDRDVLGLLQARAPRHNLRTSFRSIFGLPISFRING